MASTEAIPRLAAWLERAHGVTFLRETTVCGIDLPVLDTSRGQIRAERVVVCPGDDFVGLYAERLAAHPLTRCKLQMLRLANPGFKLPAAFDVRPRTGALQGLRGISRPRRP